MAPSAGPGALQRPDAGPLDAGDRELLSDARLDMVDDRVTHLAQMVDRLLAVVEHLAAGGSL